MHGVAVCARTRTWAERKGHATCAMTLIRLGQDCHWIRGRLVNWKHVPSVKWLPLPPPTTRRPATNVMRVSFVCRSRMSQITSPFASTAMVRSTWFAPIYYSSRSQARTVSSPRRICRNTRRCDCVRCHWPRGRLCTYLSTLPRQNCSTEDIVEGIKGGGKEIIVNLEQRRDY